MSFLNENLAPPRVDNNRSTVHDLPMSKDNTRIVAYYRCPL